MKRMILVLIACSMTGLLAADGADLYKRCAGCHGQKGDKKALGKSKIIRGWAAADTKKALLGYKNGSYGGPIKALMKSQISTYKLEDIKAVSIYIEGLK